MEKEKQFPILKICMDCEPGVKHKEWYRLSHWYCKKHWEEHRRKWNEEINNILNIK
jgi:hypothetical protein